MIAWGPREACAMAGTAAAGQTRPGGSEERDEQSGAAAAGHEAGEHVRRARPQGLWASTVKRSRARVGRRKDALTTPGSAA